MFKFTIDNELELKLLELRYADELFALTDQNRLRLRQWLPWVDDTKTADDTRTFIQGALHGFAISEAFAVGIWYKGQLAGTIDLHNTNWDHRLTEIGYWLGAKFEGKGVMTRAARAMTDYALNELKLNRVVIRAATGNAKS